MEKIISISNLRYYYYCFKLVVGHKVWVKYCRLYAQQLRKEGSIHHAVTYLLYTHDIDTAIIWLMEDNLYRYMFY